MCGRKYSHAGTQACIHMYARINFFRMCASTHYKHTFTNACTYVFASMDVGFTGLIHGVIHAELARSQKSELTMNGGVTSTNADTRVHIRKHLS